MKVSVSDQPEARPARTAMMRAAPWLLAGVFFAAHLPFLAPTLEDVDSINFALGLRNFDPARHQPHPPGYPVYIALGRLSLAAVEGLGLRGDSAGAEALALAFWSALAGALAIVWGHRVFTLLAGAGTIGDARAPTTLWATVLLACTPLFWMTGARPMSDMPGLAAALGAQALLLGGGTQVLAGAFAAGLAVGVRSQTAWLTAPLMIYLLWRRLSRGGVKEAALVCASYGAGALAWAVPLVIATGGPSAYLAALSAQAGDDFAFVEMLWTNPTPRQLALALYRTLVLPWHALPLAVVVLALAAAGGLFMLVRERRTAGLFLILFGPYVALHLVFQETVTVRYALPVAVAVVFAAARAVAAFGRPGRVVAVPAALAALIVAVPGVVAYGRGPHPAFRAVEDMLRRAESAPPAFVTPDGTLSRALEAAARGRPGLAIRAPRTPFERMELVNYWAGDGRGPVWFLADPRRTSLELMDPRSRLDVVRYRWSVGGRGELSGTRPRDADWYKLLPPGWFLGEGWSLTPETGGVAAATGKGPHLAPIVGYVRRQQEPVRLMIGARHLGEAGDGATNVEMALDGRTIAGWTLTYGARNLLRFLLLPDGVPAGEGDYARLTVVSHPIGDAPRTPPVAIRQFDAQPASRVMFGYGPGWHEAEYEFASGQRWRWTSDRATLQIRGATGTVAITLSGESPLRYVDAVPTVTMRAGARMLGQLRPSGDFRWRVEVPFDVLMEAGGEVHILTDKVYLPGQAEGTADARVLGLRIFECAVTLAQ